MATNAMGRCLFTSQACRSEGVCVCFPAAAGKQAPSCWLAELSERCPCRRGGRVARTQTAAWYTEVAMAALCRYTLHKKAVMLGHTDSFFVLHRRLTPTLRTEEQNKYWNTISTYTYVLRSIVRLHLTVELGLKHLGNNLHTVSTTTSLPLPPFPLAAQNKPTPWHPSQQNGSLLRLSVFMKLI